MGRSGYSREDAIYKPYICFAGLIHTFCGPDGVDFTPVYNTLDYGARGLRGADAMHSLRRMESVIRCPECSAEIDVDEDEVEEGEILSCPECEAEREVSQTHPVHLNIISDDIDEDEEEEDGEAAENGDLL